VPGITDAVAKNDRTRLPDRVLSTLDLGLSNCQTTEPLLPTTLFQRSLHSISVFFKSTSVIHRLYISCLFRSANTYGLEQVGDASVGACQSLLALPVPGSDHLSIGVSISRYKAHGLEASVVRVLAFVLRLEG
jgi:hypothetical protein